MELLNNTFFLGILVLKQMVPADLCSFPLRVQTKIPRKLLWKDSVKKLVEVTLKIRLMSNIVMESFHNNYLFPYLKTDGTSLRILFSVRNTKQDSMKIIMEQFYQKLMEVMLDNGFVSNLINLTNSTFLGKKKPFGMCIVQMSDMIGGAISKAVFLLLITCI